MSEENLFREVEDELRAERLKRLWDRYGLYVIAVCLVVIVGVAGMKGWQAWELSQAETAGAEFEAALTLAAEGNLEEAAERLAEIARDAPRGYATLARLQQAAALAETGDTAAAVRILDEVAADSGADDLLRGFARIRAATLLVDTADRAEIESRLSGMTAESNPWRHSAQELLALAAYRSGDLAEADRLFNEIVADGTAPMGVRQRAHMMVALITPRLGDTVDKSAASGDQGAAGG